MSNEFNPDPFKHSGLYIDRTYASGVAQERPKLTTRIHCEPEPEETMREAALSGPAHARAMERIEEGRAFRLESDSHIEAESQADWFCRELRAGHGCRNSGDE